MQTEPTVSAQHATPASQHQLETVTDAITRLRSEGFTNDFHATELAELACQGCRRTMDPREVQVHQTVRFEGDTNPDDQDIVFAMSCSSGCKGIYSAAYGPSSPPNDTAVLQKLARPAPVPSRTGPSDV